MKMNDGKMPPERVDELGVRFEGEVLGRAGSRERRREAEVDALLALAAEEYGERLDGVWEYDAVLLWHCRLG